MNSNIIVSSPFVTKIHHCVKKKYGIVLYHTIHNITLYGEYHNLKSLLREKYAATGTHNIPP